MGGVCGTSAQRAEIKRLYDYSLFLQLMGPDRVDMIVRRVEGSDADGSNHPATGRIGQIALVFDGTVELFSNGNKVHVVHARMPLDNGPPVSIIERPRDARYAPGPKDQGAAERNNSNTCSFASVKTNEALLYWKSDSEIVCRYALETGETSSSSSRCCATASSCARARGS